MAILKPTIKINQIGEITELSNEALVVTSTRNYQYFNLNNPKVIYIDSEPEIELLDKDFEKYASYNFENIIAIGGGSVIDAAKILKLAFAVGVKPSDAVVFEKRTTLALPLIALVTIMGSGTDATTIAVYKQKGIKKSVKDDSIVVDKTYFINEVFASIPESLLFDQAADIYCHAVESKYSLKSNTLSRTLSTESLAKIARWLESGSLEDLYYASYFAGLAEDFAGVSVIHGIAYALQNINMLSHARSNRLVMSRLASQLFELEGAEITIYKKLLLNDKVSPNGEIIDYVKDFERYPHLLANYSNYKDLTKDRVLELYESILR
jgi:alcohol dehydrogenase class IV